MVDLEDIESTSEKFGALGIEDDTPLILSNKSKTEVASKLNSSLYDFQRAGVQFLYRSFAKDSGAILSDVPGSGKKVQVIAFISALISSQKALLDDDHPRACHPALIICRKEKIRIWENRIKSWSSLKYSVCSDLNIDKATDSVDIVLFPFDLLSKSVVSVAKRKWTVLFVDNIEVISLKPKYELLLHHLPPMHRFGIASKNLDKREILAAVVGWVFPKYYEQLKKDKAKVFSYIKQFDEKTGTISDQIRGLHFKADLLSLRNEIFVKRDGDIPVALSSLPRDEEEEEETFDFPPSTSSAKVAPSRSKKRRSNEKIAPRSKSQRISARTLYSSDSDEDDSDSNQRSRVSKARSSTNCRPSKNKVCSKESGVGVDYLANRNQRTRSEKLESKPSCSKDSNNEPKPSCSKHHEQIPSCSQRPSSTEEKQLEDPIASESVPVQSQKSDFDEIDALFLSSSKVLKSPQKSKKKTLDATKRETETKNIVEPSPDSEETSSAQSPDLESKQFSILNSLFLKTPPVSKPAPSKFRSFTQASQKTNASASRGSSGLNVFGSLDEGESQDLDSSSFCESQTKKPPRKLLETAKDSYSAAPENLLEDLFFTQTTRKAPPKRKQLTQADVNLNTQKPASRQPMQFIKNWDLDSAHLDDLTSKKNRFS